MAVTHTRTEMPMRLTDAILACLTGAALAAVLASPAAAADLNVTVDEAKLVQLKGPAAEIVLGNPSIADVAVLSARQIVVTGKSFGRTNLIVLDANGKETMNTSVSVSGIPRGVVTVHRGGSSISVYCAPNCGSALTVGDSADYFGAVSNQVQTKQSISRGAADGSAAQ